MQRVNRLIDRWFSQSLARQFLLAGGLVALLAMLLVGALVTRLIEDAVTRNSAAITALYVDSVIAPLLPDMRTTEALDPAVTRALDETMGHGALGDRLISFRIWRRDGTILYASDGDPAGTRAAPGANVETAFSGEIVAEFDRAAGEAGAAQPLLRIYNPILQPWSGEVVAVSEFHELATGFQRSLDHARLRSWLSIAFITLCFFLTLSAIVLRGSRLIDRQRAALKARVSDLSELLKQNRALHARVRRASQRAAALNESHLRRIGADLHDGPAQLVAFAALRLDGEAFAAAAARDGRLAPEISAIRSSLDEAMQEIRSICNGLVLPHIESAGLPEILARAVRAHEQRTGAPVGLELSDPPASVSPAARICIFRFVQEALNNGYRHGGGIGQSVTQSRGESSLLIEVADGGPGFDPENIRPDGIGLAALRERVESLGGRFRVESSPGKGTRVSMWLDMEMEEMDQA